MKSLRVVHKINNLEILSKLMNSVAKQCDCRVKYSPEDGRIRFFGNSDYRKYIAEQTLSFFQGN
jgi:hypothetical protein